MDGTSNYYGILCDSGHKAALGIQERLTDAVNGMNTNIKLTIQQLENTNKSLEIVTAQNKKQDDRLTALEKAPGVFGNKLWWAVIAAFVSGFVAYELTALLH